jgi:hypothetical protein
MTSPESLQELVGGTKWVVIRGHEHAILQIDPRKELSPDASQRRSACPRIVRRTQHPPSWPMPVALDHLKVVDDFALVPDVVPRGNHVDVEFEQLLGQRRSDPEASSRVLAIRDDQVDGVIADNPGQPILDNVASRSPEDVANEENSHEIKAGIRW